MAADSHEEVFELDTDMAIQVYDADGYIIEYGTPYYPDSNDSGDDGLVIVRQ